MNARTRRVGPGSPDGSPHCRVFWDGTGEVAVWVANGDQPGWAWRQRIEVIEAVADRALDQVRDEARGAGLALDAVEVLRDPRMIVPLTIAAMVQVAAVHAGIPLTTAKLLGDAAGKLGQRLLGPGSGRDQDPAVCYIDFGYDADAGRTRPENPEIHNLDRTPRGDAIGELLDPRRDGTTRADRGTSADRGRPAAGVTRRGTSQDVRPARAARVGPDVARRVLPDPLTDRNKLRGVSRGQPQSRGDRDSRGGRGDLGGR
jgi:hypothetical protein